jgi:hypothetical protein
MPASVCAGNNSTEKVECSKEWKVSYHTHTQHIRRTHAHTNVNANSEKRVAPMHSGEQAAIKQ